MKKLIVVMLVAFACFSLSGCTKNCELCHQTGSVTCLFCDSGETTCTTCNGKAYDSCLSCIGKGRIYKKCDDCTNGYFIKDRVGAVIDEINGTYTQSNYSDAKCFSCKGKKEIAETCLKCNGDGKIKECSSCSASGKMSCKYCGGDNKTTCKNCNGNGKINY